MRITKVHPVREPRVDNEAEGIGAAGSEEVRHPDYNPLASYHTQAGGPQGTASREFVDALLGVTRTDQLPYPPAMSKPPDPRAQADIWDQVPEEQLKRLLDASRAIAPKRPEQARFGRLYSVLRTDEASWRYITDAAADGVILPNAGVATPAAAPGTATATTGGSLIPGTYTFGFTWITQFGETALSPTQTQIVPAGTNTNTITVTVPALPAGAIGWNLYFAVVGTTTPLYKQPGSPFTGLTTVQTAQPTASGANPPAANTSSTPTIQPIVVNPPSGPLIPQFSQYPGGVSGYVVLSSFAYAAAGTGMTGALVWYWLDPNGQAIPLGCSAGTDTSVRVTRTLMSKIPITDAGTPSLGSIMVKMVNGATPVVCAWQIGVSLAYLLPSDHPYHQEQESEHYRERRQLWEEVTQ